MNRPIACLLAVPVAMLVASCDVSSAGAPPTSPRPSALSRYTSNGALRFPADYRTWIFLSSGLDMNYRAEVSQGRSVFDNVLVEPLAYRAFVATGEWPEGTLLVKENRLGAEKGSINQHGHFQTATLVGIEVHAKDSRRFPGGWAFYFFPSPETRSVRALPTSAECYSCHRKHGAVDTTFVQFYPTLLGITTRKEPVPP